MVHQGTSSSIGNRLYRALVLLGLVLLSYEHLCVFGLHGDIYIYIYIFLKKILLTFFSLPFSELSLVGLALDLVD